jgi:type IV pilus assembly protein PilM
MANNTVTLYISDTSIRLMVTRGRRITKLAEVPLDTNLGDINTEEKETELISKIKLLFKSNKIAARKIILGLSGLHCLTRPVILPELPRAMLSEAITREARRVLPVPLEQLYISWQIISVSEAKIQAFMVAVPRQLADMLVRVLNKAGYKPYLMDIKPLALARLSREANALIVDVQPKEFDIVIMVSGIPQPIRTVAFPEESLSLKEKISIIKEDIKRTLQFHNSNNPENHIQSNAMMLVSGELAEEPELYEALAFELGFKVALLSSPLKCQKQLDPSHHLVNVGLAIKEIIREAGPLLPNFNTLPEPYQPRPISINRILAIPASAVAVGLIVVLAMTIQNAAASIETVQNQLNSSQFLLEKKQAQKKELTQSVAALEQNIAGTDTARRNCIAALESFSKNGDLIDNDLGATVDSVVNDLALANINHSGIQVSLSGNAASEQEVLKYVRKLDATGRFSEITISNLTRVVTGGEEGASDNGSMTFSLNIKLKDIVK